MRDHQQRPTTASAASSDILRSRPAGRESGFNQNAPASAARDAGKPAYPHHFMLRDHPGLSDEERALRTLVRAKLRIGDQGDQFEQEADRIAARVVSAEGGRSSSPGSSSRLPMPVSRMPVATASLWAGARSAESASSTTGDSRQGESGRDPQQSMISTAEQAITSRGPGRPMQPSTRGTLETELGTDLGDVRVHDDPAAQRSAAALDARAFTHRNHIWLGPGESQSDLGLMAHETAHVLQQDGVVRRKPAPPKDDEKEKERKRKEAIDGKPSDQKQEAPEGSDASTDGMSATGERSPMGAATALESAGAPSAGTATTLPADASMESEQGKGADVAERAEDGASGESGSSVRLNNAGQSGSAGMAAAEKTGAVNDDKRMRESSASPAQTRVVGTVQSDPDGRSDGRPAADGSAVAEQVAQNGAAKNAEVADQVADAAKSAQPDAAATSTSEGEATSATEGGGMDAKGESSDASGGGSADAGTAQAGAVSEGETATVEDGTAPESVGTGPGAVGTGPAAGTARLGLSPTVTEAMTQLSTLSGNAAQIGAVGLHFGGGRHMGRRARERAAAADAKGSDFLARNAQRTQAILALGQGIPAAIMGAAETAKAGVDATITDNINKLVAAIAGSRAQVTAEAAKAKAAINADHTATVSAIKRATAGSQSRVNTAHQGAVDGLSSQETAELLRIDKLYQNADTIRRGAGPRVGARAISRGEDWARMYLGQLNGESTLLEGPLHDNRLHARADAARAVAAEYNKGIVSNGAKQASAAQQGKPRDVGAVRNLSGQSRNGLDAQLHAATTALNKSQASSLKAANTLKKNALATVDEKLQAVLTELTGQESVQTLALQEFGKQQKGAIDHNAELAILSLMQGVAKATGALNDLLGGLVAGARNMDVPDPEELDALLAGAEGPITEVVAQLSTQIPEGIESANRGLATGVAKCAESVNLLGASGVDRAAKVAAGFTGGTAELLTSIHGYSAELTKTHKAGVDSAASSIAKAFGQSSKGVKVLFTTLDQKIDNGLRDSANGFEQELGKSLGNLDPDIRKEGDKAAAEVQPRWKTILKVVLVIAVIVVVAFVVGPAVVGFIAGAAEVLVGAGALATAIGTTVGGAIVGAVAGAAIQIGSNIIDEKKNIFEGVGKAAAIGAITGFAGGLGGTVSGAVGATLSKVGQFVLRGGINVLFDIGGTITGDLATGEPITLEGIIKGVVIGMAAGGLLSQVGRLGKFGAALEEVQGASANAGQEAGASVGGRVKASFEPSRPTVSATEPSVPKANAEGEPEAVFGGPKEENVGTSKPMVEEEDVSTTSGTQKSGENEESTVGGGKDIDEAEQGGLNLFKWKHETSTTETGWKEGDNFLLLPDKGSAKANWKQNSGRLREAMGEGKPIFDSYREPNGELIPAKGFLAAERNLLQSRGWKYNPETGAWHPPTLEVQGATMSGAKSSGTTSTAKPHLDAPEIEPGVVAKETFTGPDGRHEVKVLKSGRIVRCSDCDDIEVAFKDELAKYSHLRERLDKIRLEPKEGIKAKMAKKLAKDISEYKAKRQGILESRSDFESQVPYLARPDEIIDPSTINVYRGGPDFKLKSKDYDLDEIGNVAPTRGLSLNTDPLDYFVVQMGGPYKIMSIPDELQIVQNRDLMGTHVEIYPKASIAPEQFEALLNRIKSEKY